MIITGLTVFKIQLSIQNYEPPQYPPARIVPYVRINDAPPEPDPIPEPISLGVVIEPEVEPIYSWQSCSCIDYIKLYYPRFSGVSLYSPWYLWTHQEEYGLTATEPENGSLIITMDNSYYWHIGVVTSVSEDRIKVIERNLRPCKITTRKLDKNDEIIVGFLK